MSSFIPKPKGMCVFLPCDGEEEEWVMTVLEVTSGANSAWWQARSGMPRVYLTEMCSII